jgi:hypothetical protein
MALFFSRELLKFQCELRTRLETGRILLASVGGNLGYIYDLLVASLYCIPGLVQGSQGNGELT